jgi:hypothetical protein
MDSAGRWMELEISMLGEISQTQEKQILPVFSHM